MCIAVSISSINGIFLDFLSIVSRFFEFPLGIRLQLLALFCQLH